MPIQVECACGKSMRVKDEWAGKKARCPACQGILVVPTPTKTKTPPPEEEGFAEVEVVEEPRPQRSTPASGTRRPKLHNDDPEAIRSRRSRREDDDEEEDRPRSRRRHDEFDDEYDDERPRSRRRREEEEYEEDERLRSRRRYDEEDDEEEAPRESRRRRPARSSGSSGSLGTMLAGVGIMVLAVAWFVAGYFYLNRIYFYPPVLFVMGGAALIKGLMGKD